MASSGIELMMVGLGGDGCGGWETRLACCFREGERRKRNQVIECTPNLGQGNKILVASLKKKKLSCLPQITYFPPLLPNPKTS